MSASPRFLVIDGYHKAGRAELAAGGASAAGDLYVRMLQKCLPGAVCDVVHPADPGASLPKGAALEQYDGIAWTGCSLTIYEDDPRVGPQIELAKAAYRVEGAELRQLLGGADGGGRRRAASCAPIRAAARWASRARSRSRPRAAAIRSISARHPSSTASSAMSTRSPICRRVGVLLASNAFTHVQAVAVTHKGGQFWGLQYHPEYNLHELARLTWCRIEKLVKLGFFRDREAAERYRRPARGAASGSRAARTSPGCSASTTTS